MKSTATRCRSCFDEKTVARGNQYFRDGAVTLLRTDGDSITAQVKGSRPHEYRVEIDWVRALHGDISAFCDCPRYADGFLCKHVWATLLQVDAERVAQEVHGLRDLSGEVSDDGELDDEPSDATSLSMLLDDPTQELTPTSMWHRQLQAVNAAAHEPHDAFQGATEAKKRRIVWYVINVQSSLREGRLNVEFHVAETKKNGEFGKIKRLALNQDKLSTLTDDRDRDLLGLLLSDSLRSKEAEYYGFRANDWTSYSSCTPSASNYDLLLPKMAATGRLVCILDSHSRIEEARTVRWDGGADLAIPARRDGERRAAELDLMRHLAA